MDVYVENNVNKIKPINIRVADVGNKRTALRDISADFAYEPALITANRKGGLDKNSFNCNDPQFGGCHRPVTRYFAASKANQSSIYQIPLQILDEKKRTELTENKKHKKSLAESSVSIDIEELKTDQISPLPSFVKQTEEMLEEMEAMDDCELEEMEMEDLMEEPIMDIDRSDSNNPLALTDYIEDIHSFYREAEGLGCVNPDYMSNQFDINDKMRAILIDWLIEVHYKFELMDETLFLMVNLIDRFLAKQKVVRKKLQLVGVTAMLLACKYEEVSVPVVDDLIQISDRAYTREEVLAMEKLMVNILQFNLSIPTAYVFLKRFLKASQADRKLELLSFFMIELCLVEYQMLKFPPSLLAAAAIYTAQCTIKGSRFWTKTAEFYTNYTENQLLECSRMMVGFHHQAGIGKLTGVHRKFSTHKFGFSARTEPARFLLS